jgi:hypothetical protein
VKVGSKRPHEDSHDKDDKDGEQAEANKRKKYD